MVLLAMAIGPMAMAMRTGGKSRETAAQIAEAPVAPVTVVDVSIISHAHLLKRFLGHY